MDTEEEEPHSVPSVEPSLRLEDNPVTTSTTSELQHENTEPQQCEFQSVSELDESGPPAPSTVSPVTEKEKEGDGKGVVDVEVVLEAAVGDEVGGGDLIAGEEKHEMLDAGDEIKASSAIDGNKEGEGVAGREESHVAEEEKADVVEDAAVDGVMEEMEKADVSDERVTAEGMEVDVAEQPVAELSEKARDSEEQKVVDDVQDQIEMPKEKEVVDVAEERGISKVVEVDGLTEQTVVMEETGVADVMENTGFMEEREVAAMAVKREILEEKLVDNEVEQTGILEETGVGNMAEKSELLEEKLVVDVAERTRIAEETGVTDMVEKKELPENKIEVNFADQEGILEETQVIDMVEKNEILEEKLVANMSEQTENLEDTNAARATGKDMAKVAKDTVMGEESKKAEDTETGNVVEDVENEEGTETETEMGDAAEGIEAAEDTEMLDMTEEVEIETAEETEDAEEDASKASGGKRSRGKNLNAKVLARASSRKKVEEDVCFVCFDGGDLVLCDRRGCPKAYHTACVGRDEAFFQAKGKWNCGLIYMSVKLAGVGFCEGTGS